MVHVNGDPEGGGGSTVMLFNIVWKHHTALDLILDFKHPMKIQLANMLYVDQLGSDVIMPLGPPKTPQMSMLEEIKQFWDNKNSENTNMWDI